MSRKEESRQTPKLESSSLVPETYAAVLYKWTAGRRRASIHGERFYAPLTGRTIHLTRTVVASCYKLFLFFSRLKTEHPMLPHHSPLSAALRTERTTYDRMALLNAWNALLLGVLYLAFQAFLFIFAEHGFSAD
ncbi:hypothetical protein FIBSPDRAFT_1040378 [Athelia psychrophila]|uniref:Uncharacterized protein n=1 Tax=Athelia psychrophila TaxID=1759441 RepID=A0A166QK41_9AGAM|nr:hypothetical protein FIBSPDRAFT_1040378 [Fibularhizoctonia sp. CBS 109695]